MGKASSYATLLNRTTAFCGDCNCSHPAEVVREDNEIYFVVACRKERKVRISTDADMFIQNRSKSAYQDKTKAKSFDYKWGYVIDITQACNCTCPVCFNACSSENSQGHLSVEEILVLADQVTQSGRKAVILSGGEPTLHPDLPDIVSSLTNQGFRVSLATNGLQFVQDRELLHNLKKSGLKMVFLQFDTMAVEVHSALRGNNYIDEKKLAANLIIDARIRLGVILTAVSLTMPGIGEVISYCGSLAPGLCLLDIQVASPSGRFELPRETIIDREVVIKAICDSVVAKGVTPNSFWPQPHFAPWRSFVHPDCSSTLLLLTENGSLQSFENEVNLDNFYLSLNGNRMRSNVFTKNLIPLFYLLKSTHQMFRIKILKHLLGFALMRGRSGVLAITINNLMHADALDESRLERCGTCFLTTSGIAAGCLITTPAETTR